MHTTYLGLGSNLGNKKHNIEQAIHHIEELIGAVERRSALLETEPWGFTSSNGFVNAAICVSTQLTPRQLLEATQAIERTMGRTHKSTDGQYYDRIIDIDILMYDHLHINEPDLTLPHPLMHQRDFVMIPLREILE